DTSVQLFLQRAVRAHVRFDATTADFPAIIRICRLVEGMPLAIELAAAWVQTLSCGEITREIERGLDILSLPARDLPARHRSMRAVFDHSWKLLTEEEQGVLLRLSVFKGGFRREAAEQVAEATLFVLSMLVTKSLVRRSGAERYDLHELIRQFAAERFTEHPEVQTANQERHSRYYLTFFSQADGRLRSAAQRETLAELILEMDNFRAAWDWAISHHNIARTCQASATLVYVYELRGWLAEGETVFRDAAKAIQSHPVEIENDDEASTAMNAMRAHSAFFSFRLGRSAEAYTELRSSATSLQSCKDQVAAVQSLWYLGIVCWELGKFAEANESLYASLEKARACGERWFEAAAGEFIGIVMHEQGEYEQARQHFIEALAIDRALGDPMITAHVLAYMSQTSQALGETAEAENFLRESLALAQEIGYFSGMGHALDGLGRLTQMTNPTEARALFAASYGVYKEFGDLRNLARVLSHQGYNALALGDAASAHDSFIAVLRHAREGGFIPLALDALVGIASLQAKRGECEQALELLLTILNHPASIQETKDRAARLRTVSEAQLTPLQIEAVQTHAGEKTLVSVVEDLLK
ncbi:MAG TPA: tetratricopeptide repeat protein, partial [Anaerolineales bacterium]|nr:tetratricopeptide repeat protein [Anaerolineales bacterium]